MPAPQLPSLGERIRTERKRRGLSLRALARAVGVSPSMMSQIETGKSRPSVTTLYAITLTLGLSFNDVFDMSHVDSPAGSPASTLIRRGTLHNGGPHTVLEALGLAHGTGEGRHDRTLAVTTGVTLQRLSEVPLHVGGFQATYAPGGESCRLDDLTRHPGWEYGFLVQGGLVLTLDGTDLRLEAGDAVSFEATAPHRYVNDSSEPAVGLWFVIDHVTA